MSQKRSVKMLTSLLESSTVVDLHRIRSALNDASPVTVFRYLKQIKYRCSYSHNGRYYTLYVPSRYDDFGLWSFEGIRFSIDGNLKQTVLRFVQESTAGFYHFELQTRLGVRVHNTLLDLWKHDDLNRQNVGGNYLYLHADEKVSAQQLARRGEMLEAQRFEAEEVTAQVVIEVLLVLIRYPGSRPGDVARRLKGRAPPIGLRHVQLVFDRYDLDAVGEKGGSTLR